MRSWFHSWFLASGPVTGAVVYRVLLSVWTFGFLATRLPHAAEIYSRTVLRQPFVVLRWLGDPIPAPWLVQMIMVALLVLLAAFAFAPLLAVEQPGRPGGPDRPDRPGQADRPGQLCRWLQRRARAMHLVILVLLSALFSFDTLMQRGYGSLAYLQWWFLWFMPYERLRDADGQIAQAPMWGLRMVQLQFCSVYVLTVLAKLVSGYGWLDGETLYYILQSERWGRFLLSSEGISHGLAQVLSLATLAGEIFVGLFLWHRRSRVVAMLACVLLHLSMALTLRVSVQFPTLMLLHLVLFVEPTRWPRLWRRLGPEPGAATGAGTSG